MTRNGNDPRGTMANAVAELAAIDDVAARRAVRADMKESALLLRREVRRWQRFGRFADTLVKFGGGSLLTTTLLLVVNGSASVTVVAIAGFTLLLLIIGLICWLYAELRASQAEFTADWTEAVLQQAER